LRDGQDLRVVKRARCRTLVESTAGSPTMRILTSPATLARGFFPGPLRKQSCWDQIAEWIVEARIESLRDWATIVDGLLGLLEITRYIGGAGGSVTSSAGSIGSERIRFL